MKKVTERVAVTMDITVPDDLLIRLYELDQPEAGLYAALFNRHFYIDRNEPVPVPNIDWVLLHNTTQPAMTAWWQPAMSSERRYNERGYTVITYLAEDEYTVEYNDLQIGE